VGKREQCSETQSISQLDGDSQAGLDGKHPARQIKRAQIPLAADAGTSDETIAQAVQVGGSTVYRTKRRLPAVASTHSTGRPNAVASSSTHWRAFSGEQQIRTAGSRSATAAVPSGAVATPMKAARNLPPC
jgi:hypothetical protein